MVAIGRAVRNKPKLVMFAEPPSGLSPLLVQELFALMKRISERGSRASPRRSYAKPVCLRKKEPGTVPGPWVAQAERTWESDHCRLHTAIVTPIHPNRRKCHPLTS